MTNSSEAPIPGRGEVWLVSMGATHRGEPGKNRPAVILSDSRIASGTPREPVVVVPLSASSAPSALRIAVTAPEALDKPSVALCPFVRGVARARLLQRLGALPEPEVDAIAMAVSAIVRASPPT